ncbi:isochorismatase family protein [Amycolatopsis roodepoortensis]|uniref:isochorismatase family protein n=1 Tax=Amycolatopsis roodepoortensis TaxID=700274 RepID=UPI00214CF95C|nr:isochorismatase family protein [Amycolatopsis roodepoortensis]UUV34726.1 isochorismatase family protein [Amycolatopsis roodepoortensis]
MKYRRTAATWAGAAATMAVRPASVSRTIDQICVAMPAIQALDDDYAVYVVTDACGGVSAEAHDMAFRRMVQAGVVPMTWVAVQAELQRDWAREATIPALVEIAAQHQGGTGVAFDWETQLLNTPATTA